MSTYANENKLELLVLLNTSQAKPTASSFLITIQTTQRARLFKEARHSGFLHADQLLFVNSSSLYFTHIFSQASIEKFGFQVLAVAATSESLLLLKCMTTIALLPAMHVTVTN